MTASFRDNNRQFFFLSLLPSAARSKRRTVARADRFLKSNQFSACLWAIVYFEQHGVKVYPKGGPYVREGPVDGGICRPGDRNDAEEVGGEPSGKNVLLGEDRGIYTRLYGCFQHRPQRRVPSEELLFLVCAYYRL